MLMISRCRAAAAGKKANNRSTPSAPALPAAPAATRRQQARVVVAAAAAGAAAPAYTSAVEIAELLRAAQELRVRDALEAYRLAAPRFARVRFVLQSGGTTTALGDSWRIAGEAAELGRWAPSVAPAMAWSEGGVWTAEVALPPGVHRFKAVLRRGDGSLEWDEAERSVVVPARGSSGAPLVHHIAVGQAPDAPPLSGTYSVLAAVAVPPPPAEEAAPVEADAAAAATVLVEA